MMSAPTAAQAQNVAPEVTQAALEACYEQFGALVSRLDQMANDVNQLSNLHVQFTNEVKLCYNNSVEKLHSLDALYNEIPNAGLPADVVGSLEVRFFKLEDMFREVDQMLGVLLGKQAELNQRLDQARGMVEELNYIGNNLANELSELTGRSLTDSIPEADIANLKEKFADLSARIDEAENLVGAMLAVYQDGSLEEQLIKFNNMLAEIQEQIAEIRAELGTLTAVSLPSAAAKGREVYTLGGQKVSGQPRVPGVYIVDGRKVVVR